MQPSHPPRRAEPPALQPVRILPVGPNQLLVVRFLGPILGLNTHWHGGKSVPCAGSGECPPALHRSRTVFKAYGPVESWDAAAKVWRAAVLEVTENLEEALRGRDLRGEVWLLTREEKRGKSDPVIGVFCESLPVDAVSPAFDVTPVLCRVFHVTTLALGSANPMPSKVYLAPVQGPAPVLPAELAPTEPRPPTEQELEAFRKQWKKLVSSSGNMPTGRNTAAEERQPHQNGQDANKRQ